MFGFVYKFGRLSYRHRSPALIAEFHSHSPRSPRYGEVRMVPCAVLSSSICYFLFSDVFGAVRLPADASVSDSCDLYYL